MPNAASPPSPPRRPRGLFLGLATADLTSAVEERPAPNTKVTAISQSLRGGGPALNAAVAFAALGGSATLFAPVGRTALSMAIREDLAEHGVALVDLADPDFAPPVSAITVCTADGSRDVVSADGAGFPLRLEDETWDALDWAAQRCDVALLDGHGGQVALEASAEGDYAGGNMEGKESRFGVDDSSLWAAYTTAVSNGSVNSMHDSYTPLGGLVPIVQMALGEVIFGGVGCGLYGMLGFAILTVFIAGLMVGRTPEFLGKKIEPFEMRMAVLVCLATPFGILVGSGIAGLVPEVLESVHNAGAHGFSEMLYAFVSCGANNGSAFAGFNGNTAFLNVALGVLMLFVRFLPIFATLAMAGSLSRKRFVATSAGTLSTTNATFVFLLIFIVLLIGALSFFPALALGPIAEFFQMIV